MKKETTGTATIISDIVCDVCGESVIPKLRKDLSDDVRGFSDYGRLSASFGYGSARDGESVEMDLCEVCFNVLVEKAEALKKSGRGA